MLAYKKYLQGVEARNNRTIGISTVNNHTKTKKSYRENQRFEASSLIKLPLAMILCHQVESGILDLDTSIIIQKTNLSNGSGILVKDEHIVGKEYPLRHLLELNITESDCVATNCIIEMLGGRDSVNNLMKEALGLNNTKLIMKKLFFYDDRIHEHIGESTPKDMLSAMKWLWAQNGKSYDLLRLYMQHNKRSFVSLSTGIDPSNIISKTGTTWWGNLQRFGAINEAGFSADHDTLFVYMSTGPISNIHGVELDVLNDVKTVFEEVIF